MHWCIDASCNKYIHPSLVRTGIIPSRPSVLSLYEYTHPSLVRTGIISMTSVLSSYQYSIYCTKYTLTMQILYIRTILAITRTIQSSKIIITLSRSITFFTCYMAPTHTENPHHTLSVMSNLIKTLMTILQMEQVLQLFFFNAQLSNGNETMSFCNVMGYYIVLLSQRHYYIERIIYFNSY